MRTLTRLSASHPTMVLFAWLVAMLLSGALIVHHAASAFTTTVQRYDGSESAQAEALLRQRFPERSTLDQPNEILVIGSDTLTVDDDTFREHVQALGQKLLALGPEVIAGGSSYYLSGDPSLVSADRRTTLIPLVVRAPEANIGKVRAVVREAAATHGLRAHLVGRASVGSDFKALAEADLRAELRIGLPAALVVLLLVFATVVAALVPLLIALASITITMALVTVAGAHVQAYFLVTNMVVMMGLAVGIDYSLFFLSRYRDERQAGRLSAAAIAMAASTAGRAILYSGATVVLALLGLLLIPTNVFRSLATGAILVVLISMAACFTLLPAIIALLGDRLEALRLPRLRGGFAGAGWTWVASVVARRPLLSLVVSATLLAACAVPTLRMQIGFAGIDTLPDRIESKRGFMILQEQFALGVISEAVVVIDADAPVAAEPVERLRSSLAGDRAFIASTARLQTNSAGTLSVLTIPMPGDAESASAQAGIERLRHRHIPAAFHGTNATALVTGSAAGYIDFFRLTERYTPIVFALVLGLSWVLLTLAFRSVVVPLKAIVMNLLSVGAAYGLMVLVFQEGVGAALLGFTQVEQIEAWIPLFLFTILYGLSMDYHVLLLSRVRERYEATGDNAEAVGYGLRTTAGIITGAALIMVAIFAGFASGELVMFQQVGFGLAVAILLDATIVRSVLVPATMTLLGDRNWYLPRWLDWLPRL